LASAGCHSYAKWLTGKQPVPATTTSQPGNPCH